MEIGVVGKPNVGKSTFFNALTLLDVPMAPYPFTTIKPNRGIAAVRAPCPHVEKGNPCTPGNAKCVGGTRWVPVSLIDVPGLVPGAHEGKGLGHQFLDDLRAADGFIQVIDASGGTGPEGTIVPAGSSDPASEVEWLENELVEWVAGILDRGFERDARSVELEGAKLEDFLERRLTGLSIGPTQILNALRQVPVDRTRPSKWSREDRLRLARTLFEVAKPRVAAANKSDRTTPASIAELTERLRPIPVVATGAEAELTLRRAARAELVEYVPGEATFRVRSPERLNAAQQRALDEIQRMMREFGGTGVQRALETMVFDRLRQIVVYPVEDEIHWTDSRGRVLPDAFLVPAETPARTMAYKVHSDLGEHFIRAIDGRTHRALAADHPLENGAVVRIVARK
jgi:ribosome-binding ATPase YchF (GTP1/OBG family)